MIKNIYLDLQSDYIPFIIQSTKATGSKVDPSSSEVIIYEEDGSDNSFSSTQITGSPFTLSKINSKTGYYGVMVDKSLFTAGNYYLVLWELTVDGIPTAGQEIYFMCNSNNFVSLSGGAYRNVYTVNDNNGDPIEGVSVRATSDAAGNNTIAIGQTTSDANGEVVLYLPLGTVYVWSYKEGYTFSNPDTELVEA